MDKKHVAKFAPTKRWVENIIVKDKAMLELLGVEYRHDKQNYRIVTENVIFQYLTPDRIDRIRGCTFDAVFLEELAPSDRDEFREMFMYREGKIYG